MRLKHLHEMDDNIRRLQRSQDPTDRLKYFAQQHRAGQLTPEESEELTQLARDGNADAAKLAVRIPDCIINELIHVLDLAQRFRNWDLDDKAFPEAYMPIIPYGQEECVELQYAAMNTRSGSYWNTSGGDSNARRDIKAADALHNILTDLNGDYGLRDRVRERDIHLPILEPRIRATPLPRPPEVDDEYLRQAAEKHARGSMNDWAANGSIEDDSDLYY